MATEEIVQKLRDAVDEVLAFDKKSLRRRPEWGKFNFDDAEQNLKRVFTVVGHLKTVPLEYLPEDIATSIQTNVLGAIPPLKQLLDFDIAVANPTQQRQSHANAIQTLADTVYKVVTPWIPFLAYQQGDVAENIGKLTKAVDGGRQLIEDAKIDIQSSRTEMDEIIEKTREASASAGAAVFTEKFATESEEQLKSGRVWLGATAALAVFSIIAAVLAALPDLFASPTTLIQAGPRFFLLAFLLTATLWSGRMYKAYMHQAAVNRHRALALQTFQAFSAAASDEQTKHAVLLEATHSIFGPSASGFLDSKANPADSGTRIVEIMKAVGAGK